MSASRQVLVHVAIVMEHVTDVVASSDPGGERSFH